MMKLKKTRLASDQSAFTIVELMIATLVFAVILVVITDGIIHFSNSYYKGINSSTTQGLSRGAIDTVAQAIQFSGDAPITSAPGRTGYVCVGSVEFAYNLGQEINTVGTDKALQQYSIPPSGSTCTAPVGVGKELLQKSTRLTQFSVTPAGAANTYNVTVGVAYGDNDLLCAPTQVTGSCTPSYLLNATQYQTLSILSDLACKSSTGSQFCDVATLTTTVQMRVNGN